jgi:hypothetical protein
MSEPAPPILAYVNPQTDPPAGSRIAIDQRDDGVVIDVPGTGGTRFALDLAVHIVLGIVFVATFVAALADAMTSQDSTAALPIMLLVPVVLIIVSYARLSMLASRPTRFEIRGGMFRLQRPLGGAVVMPIKKLVGFVPRTIGFSVTFRALGMMRIDFTGEMPLIVMKRYYHAEVVWVATMLNDELARQISHSSGGDA